MKNKLSVDRVSRGGVIRSGVDWGWVVRSGGGGVRSRSMVDKGSMMGRVSGGGMVRGGVMRGGVVGFDRLVVADLSFVFDISVVLLVFIDVIVNDLGTAIGQLHSVLSCKIIHHH